MSDLSTAPTPDAIEWQKPKIHDTYEALEQTLSRIERLGVLLTFSNSEMVDFVVSDKSAPKYAHDVWVLYVLAAEKLDEIKDVVGEVIEVLCKERGASRTSVGKHTDIMRRRHWIAAVEAYRAADALPVTDDTDEAVGNACAAAFQAMVETPAPDLRAFHEKLTLIQSHNAWSLHGATDALFADVERFARAEIAAAKLEG